MEYYACKLAIALTLAALDSLPDATLHLAYRTGQAGIHLATGDLPIPSRRSFSSSRHANASWPKAYRTHMTLRSPLSA